MRAIKDNNFQQLISNQKRNMAFNLLNKGFKKTDLLLWGNYGAILEIIILMSWKKCFI